MLKPLRLEELLQLLNERVLSQFNTVIKGGFQEPFYKTFCNDQVAEIQFSYDYTRSALHELAHWCVAGRERRNLDDYGYWYAADGRNQQQQDEFFKVEVKPQAIEWAFSLLCGVEFEASVDNLNQTVEGIEGFEESLSLQMNFYLQDGFPPRADQTLQVLADYQKVNSYRNCISNHLKSSN